MLKFYQPWFLHDYAFKMNGHVIQSRKSQLAQVFSAYINNYSFVFKLTSRLSLFDLHFTFFARV